jgi:hypothetical protein
MSRSPVAKYRVPVRISSLHVPEKFFPVNICLFENRKHCAGGQFRMVGNRHESPGFRMQEMNMTAGLPYRFKSKFCKDLNNFKS